MAESKNYLFKMHFKEMETYREIKVQAPSDEDAKDKAQAKFQNDPFVYLIDKEDNTKILRSTFEIEGGDSSEPKRQDPSGHQQINKVGTGQ